VPTLRVLGGLWLDDGDGRSSGRGAQRRRLALLTLLALSPGRRITRDKALASLWPENSSVEGRRRLSSAVYDLRTMLGDDAIESGGDELWVAPAAALRTDVDDFEAAFARGDAEAALAAYGGPLLDGVHLSGAPEFEEWIASQRERLRRLYLQGLEQAAATRLASGDDAGAVSASLRLADLEPLSGHAALVAVTTLVGAGDRPHALHVARAHAARVRRELGVESDDAVLAAAQRPGASSGTRATQAVIVGSTTSTSRAADTVAPDPVQPASTVARGDERRSRRLGPLVLRGAVAAAIVVTALAGAAYRSRASAAKGELGGSVSLSGLSDAASRSTTSPVALKAFLDGESAYENGRYDAAVKFFHDAVVHDSTFAFAHVRLSESLLWQEQPAEFAAVHDSLALRWSSNLSDDDRLLIRAYVAWRRGDYAAADSLDRIVLPRDPTSPNPRFQMGEVLFHYNPLRGRSIGEAGPWFTQVLHADSANWGARWHLLLLDAARLSPAELRDRTARLLAAQPDGHVVAELRLFAADNSELPRLAAAASRDILFDAAWRRAVFRRDLSGAESLLVGMTEARRSENDRTVGSFAIASLRFARGDVDGARLMLDGQAASRATGGDAWVLLVHGLLANRGDTGARLDTLARAIEHWRQTLPGFDQPTSAHSVVARYLGALLAVARGDTTPALRLAAELDDLAERHDPLLPPEFRNPHELAQTIRVYRDFRAGRCESALRHLDAEKGSYWLGVIASSPLAAQSFERYLRAECLLALGRNAEAIAWFETFEQNTLYDFEFLGTALRGQALGHRALGNPDAAAAIERRLAELQSR
jgi:DNA-binding SARP family transcriptional activator